MREKEQQEVLEKIREITLDGIKQKDIAELAGYRKSTLSHHLSGRKKPTEDSLARMLNAALHLQRAKQMSESWLAQQRREGKV